MSPEQMAVALEGALLAAGRALTVDELVTLFEGHSEAPDRAQVRAGLAALDEMLGGRAIELMHVASGYRLQVRAEQAQWLSGLFAERPPRYSRALLETLALIAYRQPITRGEIEEVRGVAVSSNIIKTLLEREWIRALGHREVPGRPALYGTTREFLDHFGLKSLDGLPALAEVKDLDQVEQDLFANLADAEARSDDDGEAGEGDPDAVDEAGEGDPDAVDAVDAVTAEETAVDDMAATATTAEEVPAVETSVDATTIEEMAAEGSLDAPTQPEAQAADPTAADSDGAEASYGPQAEAADVEPMRSGEDTEGAAHLDAGASDDPSDHPSDDDVAFDLGEPGDAPESAPEPRRGT